MEIDCIPFRNTGYFSKLICDYLDNQETLTPFFNRFPTMDSFREQLEEKTNSYPPEYRIVLGDALSKQYEGLRTSSVTLENIESLKQTKTFTVVTGHQLNLFTGPMYFLYKIISTINLTELLKEKYPEYNFVPIYWMATEDHDFEEINYFNFGGQKIRWNLNASGAVGRLSTTGLEEVANVFRNQVGISDNARDLLSLFEKAYLNHKTLSEATRYLANSLFGNYGLVIVDGDDRSLKQLLVPYAKQDIFDHLPYGKVTETAHELSAVSQDYAIQVNPREINYFYLLEGVRERIVEEQGSFKVNGTSLQFSREELVRTLEDFPERFSPNVIARPLYQEIVLPNLCYIGGGGELAYWLELKSYFESMKITFPTLLLRNSALIITEKNTEKLNKMQLGVADLFLKQSSLINKKIRQISNIAIDFTPQKKALETQFEALYELAQATDASFLGAVKAQEVKQKKGLDTLEKRLLKAQKRKLKDHVVRLTTLQNQLFPNQSLQERQLNFSELYLEYGAQLIPMLKRVLDPLKMEFLILRD
ncbi:MAG: bacillithiol biosynthesis cysteine-adding enzyme BshC [Bacteroidota bacterium]